MGKQDNNGFEKVIYTIVVYYNRKRLIFAIASILVTVPLALAFFKIAQDRKTWQIWLLSLFFILLIVGTFLDSKVLKIKTLSLKNTKNVFWLNRHSIEEYLLKENKIILILASSCWVVAIAIFFFIVCNLKTNIGYFALIIGLLGLSIFFIDLVFGISTKHKWADPGDNDATKNR